jgi:acetylornithine deacetylase/succinyl-diaminopimelate desuccinylase-like protein
VTATSTRSDLAKAVDASRDDLVAVTRALVAIASPNPPSDTTAIAPVAADLLRTIPGAEVEIVESAPGILNVVARIAGRGPGRRLIFNGHLDTFPIGEDLGWTVPPLGGVMKDGRLYGRGVSDMKGGIACSLLAARLLAERRDAWPGEIVVTLAGDEENMGSLGTGWLLEHMPLAKGDANICGDVGSPDVIRFGEKGLLWIEVEAVGKPAHGAHVHKGVNAIDRLLEAVAKVRQLEALPVEAPAEVTAAIAEARAISEPISGAGEAATLGRVTVNFGTISGGVSPNLVPSHAIARADIRLPVGVTTDMLIDNLTTWLSLLEGVTWRAIRRFEPSFTPPSHAIIRATERAATEVLGRKPAVNMRVGASDSRWYRMFGVPTVVYGLTPYNMGGPDEYVVVDEMVAVAKVHALAAFDFLNGAG